MHPLVFLSAHPMVKAALAGFVGGVGTAAEADWQAFKTWTSFADVKKYNWSLALFNWLKGGILGAGGTFTAAGILGFLGA